LPGKSAERVSNDLTRQSRFGFVIPGDAKHRTRNLEIPSLVLRTIPE